MRTLSLVVAAAAMALAVSACEPKGPAQRAGASIDKAGQNVRDAVDPPTGPVEKAGRAIDRAVQ